MWRVGNRVRVFVPMSGATSSGDGDANGQPVKAPPSVRPLLVKPMAPCDNQPVLKEVGLRVLRTLVTHVRPTLKPVQRVGALLAQIGENGCALFKDWSPPSAAPDAPVPLIQGSALASSRLNLSTYAASKALDSGSFWASTANEDAAWWMASIMGDAAPLQPPAPNIVAGNTQATHLRNTDGTIRFTIG